MPFSFDSRKCVVGNSEGTVFSFFSDVPNSVGTSKNRKWWARVQDYGNQSLIFLGNMIKVLQCRIPSVPDQPAPCFYLHKATQRGGNIKLTDMITRLQISKSIQHLVITNWRSNWGFFWMTIVFRATGLENMLSLARSQIPDTKQQSHRHWGEENTAAWKPALWTLFHVVSYFVKKRFMLQNRVL